MSHISSNPAREVIDLEELERWRETGTIVSDDRRRRPYWFDGRFLDAAALNAEQNYFLARQADYGRAAGFGVIEGLGVQLMADRARVVRIGAGQGITPSGAQVLLDRPLTVDLAAVAETQRLDAGFGLASEPRASSANRSGLFILALRPVEFSGDPITTYPTRVEGSRGTRDGSVIEATAVTLIPYPDRGARSELADRRSRVAREIFFEESLRGQPEDVLPLAMLALDHGIVRWLDVFMVRREMAQCQRGLWGLGVAPRSLRAAHLRQYGEQLEDLLARDGDGRFLAGEHFSVLPPAGPMPVGGVDADDFTHSFFPAEMDVELSLLPADELPALLEEALRLPPIDLEGDAQARAATAVLVLMPVPRGQFQQLATQLPSLRRALPPAQPGGLVAGRPIALLDQLLSGATWKADRDALPADEGDETAESAWRTALASQSRLWFVRRSHLPDSLGKAGKAVWVASDEREIKRRAESYLADAKLKTAFREATVRATPQAVAEITSLLASPLVTETSPLVSRAILGELGKTESIDSDTVKAVAGKYTEADFGAGLARLETLGGGFEGNARLLDGLARSGRVAELDHIARSLPDEDLKAVAETLREAASGSVEEAPAKLAKVIDGSLETFAASSAVAPFAPRLAIPTGGL